MGKHFGSMAYRIVGVGIEKDVRSYTADWATNGEKKYLHLEVSENTDDRLAYADVVLMTDAPTWRHYEKVLEWYARTIGSSSAQARDLKPKEKLPMLKHMRVYWYHPGSIGYKNTNVGWAEILSTTKMDQGTLGKILEKGNSSTDGALDILAHLKVAHDQGKHGAFRPCIMTDRRLGRSVIASMPPGKVFMWAKGQPGNRGDHLWDEDIHGRAVRGMLEHRKLQETNDSGADWMGGLVSSPSVIATADRAAVAEPHTPRDCAKLRSPSGGKISMIKEKSRTGTGTIESVYTTPDGNTYRTTDKGYREVAARYFAQLRDEETSTDQE